MSEVSLYITEEEVLNFPNDTDLGKYIRRRYWDMKRKQEEKNFVEYDRCQICGEMSPYTKETHIDDRVGYVEGGGQGCFKRNECEK